MQIEFIRRMPPWKKIAIVDGLNETVKALATAGIKQRNPNATPEQVHRMLAELILGSELARKVYGEMNSDLLPHYPLNPIPYAFGSLSPDSFHPIQDLIPGA